VSEIKLELYIVGQSRHSEAAVTNLRRLCEDKRVGDCQLEIIDVLEHPDAAEAANIVATPTLIKRAPAPVRRIVGDLSVAEAVLDGLNVNDHQTDADEA
jgi:circadian clock protein KaiB